MEMPQSDMNETLITLTSDIVAAHVSNNRVSVDEVTALISKVYGALDPIAKAELFREFDGQVTGGDLMSVGPHALY